MKEDTPSYSGRKAPSQTPSPATAAAAATPGPERVLLDVGGIALELRAPDPRLRHLLTLPEAYRPFERPVAAATRAPHGTLELAPADGPHTPEAPAEGYRTVATGLNDLGESVLQQQGESGGYRVGITPRPGLPRRYMYLGEGFRRGLLLLDPWDPWDGFLLDSMLRIFFSQVAVLESSFLVHASAVLTPRGAHLFMGRSGTGKSTHSSMWLGAFGDCALLNDDNPLVRLHHRPRRGGARVTAHGTPWSGKTPCWVDRSAPLLSLTRLSQAPRNRYTPLEGVAAFVAVLPGVSVISHCPGLYARACRTLGRVVQLAATGTLECLPDTASARLLRSALAGSQESVAGVP